MKVEIIQNIFQPALSFSNLIRPDFLKKPPIFTKPTRCWFHQSFRCQDVILVSSLTRQGVVQMGAGAHSAGSSSFFFGSKCHRRNRVFLFFFPPKKAGNYEVAENSSRELSTGGVVDLVGSVCSLQLQGRKPKTQDLRCWWWWFRPRPIISHCWSIGRIMGENHLHKMESVGNWSKIHVASNWNLWLLFY